MKIPVKYLLWRERPMTSIVGNMRTLKDIPSRQAIIYAYMPEEWIKDRDQCKLMIPPTNPQDQNLGLRPNPAGSKLPAPS
jgi:hypothetical protein